MLKFSQRIGVTPIPSALQKDSMTPELRNSLWNFFYNLYIIVQEEEQDLSEKYLSAVWSDFYKFPIDEIRKEYNRRDFIHFKSIKSEKVITHIKKWFETCEWHAIYDFIEFLVSFFIKYDSNYNFSNTFNLILERELSAYRFIDGILVEITSDREIKEIENALENTAPYPLVTQHLRKSMNLLSDRTAPDYQNSIKESISSVEALLRHFTSDNSIILSKALIHPLLKKHFHPTLLDSLGKLYSYRGDQSGIGHSSKPESNFTVNSHEAKFFLIVCSAYINLIITTLSNIPPDAK